ncbi:hypothetical protein D3C87_1635620 [compost metagenome]
MKSLPHSAPAAPKHEQPQRSVPIPALASSASTAPSPAIILTDAESSDIKSLPIATTIRNHAQTIALDTSLPPEARAALAEDLLDGLVRALARAAVEMQTCPSPSPSEPEF